MVAVNSRLGQNTRSDPCGVSAPRSPARRDPGRPRSRARLTPGHGSEPRPAPAGCADAGPTARFGRKVGFSKKVAGRSRFYGWRDRLRPGWQYATSGNASEVLHLVSRRALRVPKIVIFKPEKSARPSASLKLLFSNQKFRASMHHPLKASGTGNFCFQSHYRGSAQTDPSNSTAPAPPTTS